VSVDSTPATPLVVLKFGGSSVGTPERFRTLVDVVERVAAEARVVVVVSALSQVTRQLDRAADATSMILDDRAGRIDDAVQALRTRHQEHAAAVLDGSRHGFEELLEGHMDKLHRTLSEAGPEGVSAAERDRILATGEQLAVPLTMLALQEVGVTTAWLDALRVVVTDDTSGEANVLHDATRERVQERFDEIGPDAVTVAAGFIGTTRDGHTTTLGFEGSDYSAALFAQMLGAQCLTRFTDVDGLYSDDPSTNADAERLESLSMDAAVAMTEAGRLGMHPKTLRPLAEAGIPMQVRSIVNPNAPGTHILPDGVTTDALLPPVDG
jgi:aspartate kinase